MNFFVFHTTCLKFGIVSNFEMLIANRKHKVKLENDLGKKLQFSTDFSQNYTKHFSNSIAMAIVDVPWDQFVLKMKAYKYIV